MCDPARLRCVRLYYGFVCSGQDVESPSALYPVMVWIHGGSNRYGCAEEYDSRVLPAFDVIVVTINYRLGILGEPLLCLNLMR